MKTNLKNWVAMLVILIVGVLGFNNNLVAQEGDGYPADLAFLSSEGALRAYAVENARQVHGWFGMNSQTDSSGSVAGVLGSPMNSIELFKFFDKMFDGQWIKTANPKDWVWISGAFLSATGDELMYGGGGARLVEGKAGYDLPAFGVNWWLASTIAIPFEGVESARMLITDTDGGYTQNDVYLKVRNGKFYFRSDTAGKGIIVLKTKSGTVIYDLSKDGIRTTEEKVVLTGKAKSSLDHMISIINPVDSYSHVERSWNGVGVNPTFEVIVNELNKNSKIDITVSSSEGAKPVAFKVRAQGNPHWKTVPVVGGRLYIQCPLERAVYYIVPVWNDNEFRSHEPYINNGGPVVAVPVEGGLG